MEQWAGSNLQKANYKNMQNTPCGMLSWMNHKLESNSWEKCQQPQIHRWYHSDDRKWRGSKELLDEGERGERRAGLKHSIQKTKIMASSSITSWQIDGENMEAVTDFIFLGSKITVHCKCSNEIKRHLLLARTSLVAQMAKNLPAMQDTFSLESKPWQT